MQSLNDRSHWPHLWIRCARGSCLADACAQSSTNGVAVASTEADEDDYEIDLELLEVGREAAED
jgi:hypothetical protein